MKNLFNIGLLFLGLSSAAYAGPKEDMIKAIKSTPACNDKFAGDDAKIKNFVNNSPKKLENLVKFKQCASSPVDLEGGCKVPCKAAGSTIGG